MRSIGFRLSGIIGAAAVALLWPVSGHGQASTSEMPDSVRSYLSEAMTLFQEKSVHRAEVDWVALEDSVVRRAVGARTPAETYRAIHWALRTVDPHSFLIPPEDPTNVGGRSTPSAGTAEPRDAIGRFLGDGVGYVMVAAHGGANRVAYVDSLRTQLAELDALGVCGWVIDLRENTGGNMWPMLAGIGPLLGAEISGSFTAAAEGISWRYRDGLAWLGDAELPSEPWGWGSEPPPVLRDPDAPIALLIGERTASSGEMVVIAFTGRAEMRTFGNSTAGFASANEIVSLRDGAGMAVTSAYAIDRLGRRSPLRIYPDEFVTDDDIAGSDAVLERAATWLRRRPACALPR